MTADLPESHADLLERPLFAHLATIRPDGSPQSSVMWFAWDGQRVRFSHTVHVRSTTTSLPMDVRIPRPGSRECVPDSRGPGRVESMDPDTDATFYRSLQQRYGSDVPVLDADVRVVIVVEPTKFVSVFGGLTEPETAALTALLEQLDEEV